MEFHCFPPSLLFRTISQRNAKKFFDLEEKSNNNNSFEFIFGRGMALYACLVFQPDSLLTSLASNLASMYLFLHLLSLSLG